MCGALRHEIRVWGWIGTHFFVMVRAVMESNSEPLLRTRAVIARSPHEPGLFLSLAPMDGVTDWVHRELATELGGVSQCVTEFIRVTDTIPPAKLFLRDCPE